MKYQHHLKENPVFKALESEENPVAILKVFDFLEVPQPTIVCWLFHYFQQTVNTMQSVHNICTSYFVVRNWMAMYSCKEEFIRNSYSTRDASRITLGNDVAYRTFRPVASTCN